MTLLGAALLATAAPVRAEPVSQPAGWGFGLMLGAPTGLTLKRWTGGGNAWDVGLGVGPGFRLHGDFLLGVAQLLPNRSHVTLDAYVGLGPVLGVSRGWCGTTYHPRDRCGGDGGAFGGVRVPFGLDARLARLPITFGLEVAPGAWVSPDYTNGLLDAFLFMRFLI